MSALMDCADQCGVAVLKLTQGYETLVDSARFEELSRWRWYPLRRPHGVYAQRPSCDADGRRVTLLLHRFLIGAPLGSEVDHRNGNTLDNRISNLRVAKVWQNQGNSRKVRSLSGFRGVSWHKRDQSFRAQITVNDKTVHIGYFDTAEAASAAYEDARRLLFGEFAPT